MTNTKDYSNRNAEVVLAQVQAHIAELEEAKKKSSWDLDYKRYNRRGWGETATIQFMMDAVYDALSIFDWWTETLSMSQLKQMEKFLKQAINLGFTGYVCFKVGAKYCAHGMWAHKEESTNGYSPDGDVLYHSFRSGDNYFDMELNGKWMRDLLPGRHDGEYEFTLAEVKQAMDTVAKVEAEKNTLADVLSMIPALDDINIQEVAQEDTTGQVFTGKCQDFRATFADAKKYLGCKVNAIRAYNGVVIILLA